METNYKISDNGKPKVSFSKEFKSLAQFDRVTGATFKIGKETLFISESKVNSHRESVERSFHISLRQDGVGRNIGEYSLSQMQFNKEELLIVRDNINKLIEQD
ncbi:hypothetical protein G9F71_008665 [Clostridium sp. FP2]|uniref:hypothetical protein n=1 Tax=Clostridium sp. FP2 TaxID=2724481 RepID=UPI0013E8F5B8|nr:hypothetical protein [Clostridium sp. FP2]MBZ9622925.1 hypothetical protein [Clostridium sp. FP2]